MSSRGGSKGMLMRLMVIAAIGAAAIVVALALKPSVSEGEVRRMVREGELIGLTLKDAAKKLRSEAPATTDGAVEFEFDQVKGWTAGHLLLDVVDGRVRAATWKKDVSDVRQDQGDGADGGASEGQGAPTGIRAKNQTSGGGGPR
jgi:hypothetical protein